jgi:hypothetical protein
MTLNVGGCVSGSTRMFWFINKFGLLNVIAGHAGGFEQQENSVIAALI